MIFVKRRLIEKVKNGAYISPQSGVIYSNGLSGLQGSDFRNLAILISDNSEINNRTKTVYVDFENIHRKLSVGDVVTWLFYGENRDWQIVGFNHFSLARNQTYVDYPNTTATEKAGFAFQQVTCDDANASSNNDYRYSGYLSLVSRALASENGIERTSVYYELSTYSGTVSSSVGAVLVPSEMEIFGNKSQGLTSEGTQYAFYYYGGTKIKKSNNSAEKWGLRTPNSSTSSSNRMFVDVTASGGRSYSAYSAEIGCSPVLPL